MKAQVDDTKFALFRAGAKDLVAVPNEYLDVIAQLIRTYGSLAQVPHDKTVRGIFLTDDGSGNFSLPRDGAQQNDITVSMLTPFKNSQEG